MMGVKSCDLTEDGLYGKGGETFRYARGLMMSFPKIDVTETPVYDFVTGEIDTYYPLEITSERLSLIGWRINDECAEHEAGNALCRYNFSTKTIVLFNPLLRAVLDIKYMHQIQMIYNLHCLGRIF